MSGEFKSTSEFYAQESEFAKEYRNGVNNVNTKNTLDKDKVAELADDDFKNISATI